MKNLLHCHSRNLHSFPISFENGLYRRVFYADNNHEMWKPIEIAIHPHHVDIKITVIDGELYNPLYQVSDSGTLFQKFKWDSYILNGKGGFQYLGSETLSMLSNNRYYAGESVVMKACELHTVHIDKNKKCVWMVEESIPTCEYFPINYSIRDLTKWSPNGLYKEVDDSVKINFIGKYLNQIT